MNSTKHLFFLFIAIISAITIKAQAPEGFNYQAIARDNAGVILKNRPITVKVVIISGTSTPKTIYEETHTMTTNDYGQFNFVIGSGNTVDKFSDINWGTSIHSLKVEIDQGQGFVEMGTVPFQSVPYSLFSKTAETANTVTNLNIALDDLTDVSIVGPTSGDALKWNGSQWVPSADDQGTMVTAGSGIKISAGEVSAKSDDPMWNSNQIQGIAVTSATPGINQVLQYNGSNWGFGNMTKELKSPWDTTATGNHTYFMKGGNVGINTMNPTNRLSVRDSLSTSSAGNVTMIDNYFYGGKSNTSAYYTSRNVVIGQGGNFNVASLNQSSGTTATNGENAAVIGYAAGTGGAYNTGVFGYTGGSSSAQSIGVFGNAPSASTFNVGVYGQSSTTGTSRSYYGIYGYAQGGANSYAGYFAGNLSYTGTLASASDAKLKFDVTNITSATETIKKLRPTTYFFKHDGDAGLMNLASGRQYGFIAQELELVLPNLVSNQVQMKGAKQEGQIEYKAVNYTALIPILTQAIKEQQDVIESLEKRISELENRD